MSHWFVAAGLILTATAAMGDSVMEPRGELAQRIDLVRDRMLHGEVPAFTDDFILADVMLKPDYPRRFSNYSGDLSGRYIGAMAMMPNADTKAQLKRLVAATLACQKPDGRFGSMDLEYTADAIGLDHMALLWGNGRMLVGLLEYYALEPGPEVLEASRKLGDFLRTVHEACANDEVLVRVKDLAAAGMICFSQLIEGLVMLADATGDKAYLEDAKNIQPWLPNARDKQHSHGYLTTLRGLVMLSDATAEPGYEAIAETLFNNLVTSDDYTLYGGVQEYFGGKGIRDEGCSEADFLRVALQLWQVTLDERRLEQANFCLLNQFYGNQFPSGDFGHQVYFDGGIQPFPGVGRAWWCCTMHGLRAFRDVLDMAVTEYNGLTRVNLYVDGKWRSGETSLDVSQDRSTGVTSVKVEGAPADGVRLGVLNPSWSEQTDVTVNGQPAPVQQEEGFAVLDQPLKKGDVAQVAYAFKARFVTKDGKELALDDLTSTPTQAALVCGPWVLGVDETDNRQFFGEPWAGNVVTLPDTIKGAGGPAGPFAWPVAHVPCTYTHDGFPGEFPVTLRPMSERTGHTQSTFGVFLNYRRGE
jgi:DUF1680 family protein